MDVCFNCGCSLEGEMAGQHVGCEGWLCIKWLFSLLGVPAKDS
ncbi:MAG: hypothetical protein ACOY30_04000 [Bacillota bacterium]